MNKLTWLEALLVNTLAQVLTILNKRHVNMAEYMETKGEVVQALAMAENYKWGCATGKHKAGCACRKED